MRIFLSAALAAASLGACAPVDRCDATSGVARDSALFASQTFVRDSLKSPASAKFPTSSDDRGVTVRKSGDCTFTVLGYVDSQNSFGAMIRSRYIAEVTPDEHGRYRLERLVIS